ncbi:MAG: hypothetical protein HY909_06565 [Deltaproteobacteria bacterium]|nr:hypothetical protein [Deltaproteobacteria bacterium]
MVRTRTIFPLAALALAQGALAQPRPVATSAIEHALGASPIAMVAGHGGLTAGVARDSDLAVLAWPGPSCCDQLTHLSSNAVDARSQPRVGVREGFGVALGLRVRTATTSRVEWFHDPSRWRAQPGYLDDRSLLPRVRLEHTSLGLTVTVTDAVLPTQDVLQRRVEVRRDPTSTVVEVSLVSHVNLGLTLNRVPRLPLGDVLADGRNDFGVLWDAREEVFVHFRPADRAPIRDLPTLLRPAPMAPDFFGPLDAMMRMEGDLSRPAAEALEGLERAFGEGVYAVTGTEPPPQEHAAGREGSAVCDELGRLVDNVLALREAGVPLALDPTVAQNFRCPPESLPAAVATARGWTRVVPSAWEDAQDGALNGNPAAAYLNDVALRTPVPFDVGGHGEARLLVAFGRSASAARRAYASARTLSASAVVSEDQARWRQRAEALSVPDSLPASISVEDRARILRASRRAMLHVYNGTDRATGAIVASIARQAPYGLDWPRDGAFFDLALDVAGDWQATSRRLAWALPLARLEALGRGDIDLVLDPAPPVDPRSGLRAYPEAAWEMNYYSDGTLGGFFRFEIDNTAWMVWSAAVHAAWAPEDVRDDLARAYWEPVRRSTEMLAAWRDPTTGLPAPAQEDDNAAFTQTLHGGTAVFAALEAAARLARHTGHPDEAGRWERRAGELRDVLVSRFYDSSRMRFVNDVTGAATTNPGSSSLGATAWLVHPARLLPYEDPRMGPQVRRDLEQVLAQLRGDPGTEGGAYLTKTTLAAAVYLARSGDTSVRPLLEEALTRLARDVIDPDTQTMGEVFVTIRDPSGAVVRRENRVSVPHLWEGALFYLSAMALARPDRFAPELSVFPANETPAPGTVGFRPPPDAGPPDGGRVDGGMDAGPGTPPRARGCGCRAPGGVGSASAFFVVAALATGTSRRRRRAGTAPRC